MAKPLRPTRRRIGPPARRLNMKGNPKLTSGAQPHLRYYDFLGSPGCWAVKGLQSGLAGQPTAI